MLQSLFTLLGVLVLLITLIPYLKIRHWSVRSFDFPLLQIAIIATALALLQLMCEPEAWWHWVGVASSLVAAIIQWVRIYPWTPLSRCMVVKTRERKPERELKILVSNVLTPNHQSDKLIAHVRRHQPDILLTLESDQWWGDELDAAIGEQLPEAVRIPLDNLYGMHLYSRLPLEETEIKWLIQDDIPSIHTWVRLKGGDRIRFHAVHPRPPAPSESEESLWRDAELLLVGKDIARHALPTVVAGDLNDVAWSRTSKLFCKVSGMLDLRRGRGQYSTFHAKYPLLRWPLDHVFVTEHFTLVNMQRLSEVGSDHFPILVTLCHNPARADENEPEAANAEEREDAEETIEEARQRHGEDPV
ncbi:endonuclease/exonuclease/phosphatase family protein [Salinicola rhizosphaerae]|uniref:Endonuclease n=1 Tax=Salinicola rhizosphaerae TaxID=1443141 RepID=A0ABQ3DPM0_9GAMM|nr:endonuclease/exonuclease/phosphatase family protein [Salinicola rhizosphaerae]GHB10768.1 endonuclease [Salinicola rhizosphaerae]